MYCIACVCLYIYRHREVLLICWRRWCRWRKNLSQSWVCRTRIHQIDLKALHLGPHKRIFPFKILNWARSMELVLILRFKKSCFSSLPIIWFWLLGTFNVTCCVNVVFVIKWHVLWSKIKSFQCVCSEMLMGVVGLWEDHKLVHFDICIIGS